MNRRTDIVMFHTGRCGSTVLGQMLNQHPAITWAGEIFNPFMNTPHELSGQKFVETVISQSRNEVSTDYYGFETKYLPQQHLSATCVNLEIEHYLSQVHQLGFTRFLLLHRENYLRRAVSVAVANSTNNWHTSEDISKPSSVFIDLHSFQTGMQTSTLLDLFDNLDSSLTRIKALIHEHARLFLSYEEDILNDPSCAYKKVCDFLNLKPKHSEIDLKKTNPFSLSELICNYDEVCEALSGTRFEWMLKD